MWLGAATNDNCDVLLAWHVTRGSNDGVDLSGLNAVMAVRSPKRMTDGGWKVALYLDDRAYRGAVRGPGGGFSGGAGGYLAWKDWCLRRCRSPIGNAADLGEPNVTEMVACIRLCLDCADICAATAGVTSRLTDYDATVTRPLLEACVAICKSCGDECERHAHMPHCRVCAEACRRCEQACRDLLDATN